jgi:hypothetical protein
VEISIEYKLNFQLYINILKKEINKIPMMLGYFIKALWVVGSGVSIVVGGLVDGFDVISTDISHLNFRKNSLSPGLFK